MQKLSRVFILAIWVGVLCYWPIVAEEITLTAPLTKPYYATTAKLEHVGWDVKVKRIEIHVLLGYYDTFGVWVSTDRKRITITNILEVPDDPNTPTIDESKPADLAYDNLFKALREQALGATFSEEKVILKLLFKDYPGIIVD